MAAGRSVGWRRRRHAACSARAAAMQAPSEGRYSTRSALHVPTGKSRLEASRRGAVLAMAQRHQNAAQPPRKARSRGSRGSRTVSMGGMAG
eukprot:scaffold10945_cov62-Phaeocystis_antarctica.AAC.6